MTSQDVKFRVVASVVGGQAIDRLKGSVDGVGNSANSLRDQFGRARTAIAGAAAAFATGAVVSYARNILNTADGLDELSQKTGAAVSDLAAFKGSVDLANVPLEKFGTSLVKLSQALVGAQGGNKETISAFQTIGVSATTAEGQIRPVGDVVRDISDAFQALPDGPQKAAIAVRLFGRAGADLIPFLNQGSEEISKFGLAIGDDFAGRAARFNDSLSSLGKSIQNGAIAALDELLPTLQQLLNGFQNTSGIFEGSVGGFAALGEAIRLTTQLLDGFVTIFVTGADTLIQSARTLVELLVASFKTIGDNLFNLGVELKNLVTGNFDQLGEALGGAFARTPEYFTEALNRSSQIVDSWASRTERRIDGFATRTDDRLKDSLIFGSGTTDEIIARQRESTAPPVRPAASGTFAGNSEANATLAKELEQVEKFKQSQLDAIALEQRKIELSTLSREEREKELAALEINQKVAQASIGLTKEGAEAYRLAGEEILKQKELLLDLESQQRQTFSVGAKQAITEYLDSVRDVAAQTKELFTNAFRGAEDAFIAFAKTGKFEFSALADSIIEDLIRIAVRQSVTGPIAGFLGSLFSPGAGVGAAAGASAGAAAGTGFLGFSGTFANGGIMTSDGPVPLKTYARGGIANSPQLALFGEGRTPEAYVPLPDGRRIPVKVESSGTPGGDSVNVVVNVNMETGSQSTQASNETGANLGGVIAQAVRQELINQKRPGGLLS